MKSVRFNRLLASTALGLALVLSAQSVKAQQDDKRADSAIPVPDTSLPPPLTAQDMGMPAPAAETPKAAEAPKSEPPMAAPVKTAEPPVTVTPKAADSVADAATADKLREIVTGKSFDRLFARKAERDGVESFYKARNYAPVWSTAGAANDRAKQAAAYLARAEEVGLDSSDYPTPDFTAGMSAESLADAELKLTASALTFARHAQIGRIHFSRIAGDIDFNQTAPIPADVLAKLADGADAGKALDSYNPPHPQFAKLREKLAELRKNGGKLEAEKADEAKPATPLVHVPDGKIMRLGMKDDRVVALRKRLEVAGDKNNPVYDEAVSGAVRAFQERSGLDPDGNAGPMTIRALNGDKPRTPSIKSASADPVDTIIVNMDRWRWFPRNLGNPHVIVNVPDYSLTLYNDGKPYWHTRIVAGKPGSHATPMISAEMKFITVNPTWNVPPSIIQNEYLPALQQDPTALERIGLKVEQAADGTVRIYQPPGAANALGRIRFNFPNKFLVYQHDTPDKNLFSKEKRAYSHGCMRVQNPLTYAEKLLSLALPKDNYTEARIERMFGGSEQNINLPNHIMVHLTYQTAFVDDDGKLQFREDVYGRDARMIATLKGGERKVADIGIERAPNTSSKPVRLPPGSLGGGGGGGGNFFDWLFGGAQASQPVPVRRERGASNSTVRYR